MNTKTTLLHTCLLSALTLSGNSYSETVDERLEDINKRLNRMEVSRGIDDTQVFVHGAVEIEYGYNEDYQKQNSSDIVLATLELAVEASINDNVDTQLTFLHEEDDTPLEVDTGVIDIHDEASPGSISLGQMYVPFGKFHSNMISDPLTLELGETRETAIHLKYQFNDACAGLYVFNGSIDGIADEDKATNFGINICFESEDIKLGIDYISSISDSDAIQDHFETPIVDGGLGKNTIIDKISGLSAHAAISIDSTLFIIEYLGAMDKYDAATELTFNGQGAEPSAMNLEVVMSVPIAGEDSTVAIAYQSTDEAVELGLPETRTMLAFTTDLYESTTLAFEYLRDTDYDTVDGGTGESAYTLTVQLATEF